MGNETQNETLQYVTEAPRDEKAENLISAKLTAYGGPFGTLQNFSDAHDFRSACTAPIASSAGPPRVHPLAFVLLSGDRIRKE